MKELYVIKELRVLTGMGTYGKHIAREFLYRLGDRSPDCHLSREGVRQKVEANAAYLQRHYNTHGNLRNADVPNLGSRDRGILEGVIMRSETLPGAHQRQTLGTMEAAFRKAGVLPLPSLE